MNRNDRFNRIENIRRQQEVNEFDAMLGEFKAARKSIFKVWAGIALFNIVVWAIIIFLIALAVKWVIGL